MKTYFRCCNCGHQDCVDGMDFNSPELCQNCGMQQPPMDIEMGSEPPDWWDEDKQSQHALQ